MKPNDLALAAIVDKLASVNAQLKELNDEAKALKELLITSGDHMEQHGATNTLRLLAVNKSAVIHFSFDNFLSIFDFFFSFLNFFNCPNSSVWNVV